MSNILKRISKQAAAAAEPEVVKCPIHKEFGDFTVSVRVPPMHNIAYLEAARSSPAITQEELEKLTDEEKIARNAERMLRVHLCGWENLKDDKGVEIPFSLDDAVEMFLSPEMKGVLSRVMSLIHQLCDNNQFALDSGVYWQIKPGTKPEEGEKDETAEGEGVKVADQAKK